MTKFTWKRARPGVDVLIEYGWKAEIIANMLRDDLGRRPTRESLLGYLYRHPELRRRWHAQRWRKEKIDA